MVTVGATESIMNGPALIPALQFPALSQTWPEGMFTAEPLVPVLWVNVAWARLASPEVASLAVNPAVWVPRHHPAFPGTEQLFAAALRATLGAVAS